MIGTKTIHALEKGLISNLQKELRDQGHHLTGSLEQSIKGTRATENNRVVLDVYANDYIDPVNTGVSAERIPFDSSRRSGAKFSQYIEGLKQFAKIKFRLDDKAALGAAFAIAKKHEKEGMPTADSYTHSSNNRRTMSIDESYKDNEKEYDILIEGGLSREIDDLIDKTFTTTVF